MKTRIFANYGVLAKEYTTVYSTAPAANADISEPVEVIIPDELDPYVTVESQIAITIDGKNYLLNEVLGRTGDAPALHWYDGHYHRFRRLRIVESKKEEKHA